jgi:hypothetical protein
LGSGRDFRSIGDAFHFAAAELARINASSRRRGGRSCC